MIPSSLLSSTPLEIGGSTSPSAPAKGPSAREQYSSAWLHGEVDMRCGPTYGNTSMSFVSDGAPFDSKEAVFGGSGSVPQHSTSPEAFRKQVDRDINLSFTETGTSLGMEPSPPFRRDIAVAIMSYVSRISAIQLSRMMGELNDRHPPRMASEFCVELSYATFFSLLTLIETYVDDLNRSILRNGLNESTSNELATRRRQESDRMRRKLDVTGPSSGDHDESFEESLDGSVDFDAEREDKRSGGGNNRIKNEVDNGLSGGVRTPASGCEGGWFSSTVVTWGLLLCSMTCLRANMGALKRVEEHAKDQSTDKDAIKSAHLQSGKAAADRASRLPARNAPLNGAEDSANGSLANNPMVEARDMSAAAMAADNAAMESRVNRIYSTGGLENGVRQRSSELRDEEDEEDEEERDDRDADDDGDGDGDGDEEDDEEEEEDQLNSSALGSSAITSGDRHRRRNSEGEGDGEHEDEEDEEEEDEDEGGAGSSSAYWHEVRALCLSDVGIRN